jgi:hypothetical protein
MLQRTALAGQAPPRGWLGARLPAATRKRPSSNLASSAFPPARPGVRARSSAASPLGNNGTAAAAKGVEAAAAPAAAATAAAPAPGAATAAAAAAGGPPMLSSRAYLTARHQDVLRHFPTALGVDDFIARVEVALCGYGFTGENSIGACSPRSTGRSARSLLFFFFAPPPCARERRGGTTSARVAARAPSHRAPPPTTTPPTPTPNNKKQKPNAQP